MRPSRTACPTVEKVRVAVTGASGNVGSAVLRALARRPAVSQVLGIARRPPPGTTPGVEWLAGDVRSADLVAAFTGCDAVIHLAWLIQPARRRELIREVNVAGSRRVFRAAAAAGVATLVHASSVGVYSSGPSGRAVDEDWPRRGVASSGYSQDKVAAEDELDAVAAAHPELRVVRLRPGLIFQRDAATEIARYFLGPAVPARLLRPKWLPVIPLPGDLRFQVVHADDVAEAYASAALGEACGAFNVAADPVLDRAVLARLFRARELQVPLRVLRAGAAVTYRLHLQPTEPGWVDMAGDAPVMDTTRARTELGWQPSYSATEALSELFEGFAAGKAGATPVLSRRR
jgi:UDP-glucose 4-epimerase